MIKYRGKTNIDINELEEIGLEHDGNWVFGTYLDGYIVNGVVEATSEYIALKNWCPVDRNTVGQYIGLKDKNGKEIYEGDVVKRKFAFYQDISKVVFSDSVCAFEMVSVRELDNQSACNFKKGEKTRFNKYFVAGYDYVEVIGNIYENPELLEVE